MARELQKQLGHLSTTIANAMHKIKTGYVSTESRETIIQCTQLEVKASKSILTIHPCSS